MSRGAVKEIGRESRDYEVRSADLADADNLKLSDGEVPEKLPEGQVESEPLVSSMTLGPIFVLACCWFCVQLWFFLLGCKRFWGFLTFCFIGFR